MFKNLPEYLPKFSSSGYKAFSNCLLYFIDIGSFCVVLVKNL